MEAINVFRLDCLAKWVLRKIWSNSVCLTLIKSEVLMVNGILLLKYLMIMAGYVCDHQKFMIKKKGNREHEKLWIFVISINIRFQLNNEN